MEILDDLSGTIDAGLKVTDQGKQHLRSTARWSKILSMIGFAALGLSLLIAIFAIIFLTGMEMDEEFAGLQLVMLTPMLVVYSLVGLIYLYPLLKLYKFSKFATDALDSNNAVMLEQALAQQKSLYTFIGIFTMVIVGMYLLVVVFVLMFNIFMGF